MADVDELARSLALARAGLGSPEGARARVRARLEQSQPAGDAAGSPSGVLPRAARGALRARAWTVGWMGLSFVAGYWLRGASELVPPRTQQGEVPAAVAAQAEPGGVAPPVLHAAEPALQPAGAQHEVAAQGPARASAGKSNEARVESRPAPRAAARQGERAQGSSTPDSLAQELALLQRVERAIRAQEGALALALLLEHERDYPASSLREERAAARVLAACVAKQGSVATRRARVDAERYLAGRAHSVYADRIRTLCELESTASSKESRSPGH